MAAWLLARAWVQRTPHPWWWLAPVYNQVEQGFRLMASLAASAGIVRSQTATPYPMLRLANGARIEFRSWEREQNLMGTSIAGGVIDEAGLLTPSAQAAISTRRSSTLGPLRYIGNPGQTAGPFRRLCNLAETDRTGTYSLHRWTWQDKHAALRLESVQRADEYAQFIEQERASLPEYEFRRLYDAEWIEDEAAVFRGLDQCWTAGDTATLAPADDAFVLGVDVAQVSDYLAAVSLGNRTRRLELRERFRGVPYPDAAVRLQSLQKQLGNAPIVLEINGPGIALAQEFDRLGVYYVPFTTTAQSKQEVVMTLAGDIQNRRVTVADHAPLPAELGAFRYERGPSGMYRYSAPQGEHDDTVMAACLARFGVSRAYPAGEYGWVA